VQQHTTTSTLLDKILHAFQQTVVLITLFKITLNLVLMVIPVNYINFISLSLSVTLFVEAWRKEISDL